jgi:hypothetical protein
MTVRRFLPRWPLGNDPLGVGAVPAAIKEGLSNDQVHDGIADVKHRHRNDNDSNRP